MMAPDSEKLSHNAGYLFPAPSRPSAKFLRVFITAVATVCLLPGILNGIGIDFGIATAIPDWQHLVTLPEAVQTEQLRQFLSAAHVHTLLEWMAVTVAVFSFFLALVHYQFKRDQATLVIGMALFFSGCMDALHAIASDRFFTATTVDHGLAPLTWAISRTFGALSLLLGAGIIYRQSRRTPDPSQGMLVPLGGVLVVLGLLAYLLMEYCIRLPKLPQILYADEFIKRPWDLIPLLLFAISGLTLFRTYGGGPQSHFSIAVWVSVLPAVASELHMVFGAARLYDHHFNSAHLLKIFAYVVPIAGLLRNFTRAYHIERTAVDKLRQENKRRRAIESQLLLSEARLFQFLDKLPVGIFIMDKQARPFFANESAKEILGRGIVPEAMPDQIAEVYKAYVAGTDELYPVERLPILRALRGEEKAIADDMEIRGEGGTKPIWVLARPIYDLNNEIEYACAAFLDVSASRQAEVQVREYMAELKRKNRELEEFNYFASHDLREPLRTLTSYSELLREDAGDALNDDALEDLDFITSAAMRMKGLVNDLLNLTQTGMHSLTIVSVDLNVCLEKICAEYSELIAETHARIDWDKLPSIQADEVLLQRLMQNLIHNAIKFRSERPPQIIINATSDASGGNIHVRDNGIGIAEDFQEKIFKPFKRLHSRYKYEGSGMGLTICRKIIELHQGSIGVESTPDYGSVFSIFIPGADDFAKSERRTEHTAQETVEAGGQ